MYSIFSTRRSRCCRVVVISLIITNRHDALLGRRTSAPIAVLTAKEPLSVLWFVNQVGVFGVAHFRVRCPAQISDVTVSLYAVGESMCSSSEIFTFQLL